MSDDVPVDDVPVEPAAQAASEPVPEPPIESTNMLHPVELDPLEEKDGNAPTFQQEIIDDVPIDSALREKIESFYKKKSNKKTAHLFKQDEHGNFVEYNKNGDIVSSTVSKKYRPATSQEIKKDEDTYQAAVKEAVDAFQKAYVQLHEEYKKPNLGDNEPEQDSTTYTSNKRIFMLNQAVVQADNTLRLTRFRNYHTEVIHWDDKDIPSDHKITMPELYFEHATENKNVYHDIAMVETQMYPLQRLFRIDENQLTSVAEANAKAKENATKVTSVRNALSAVKNSAVATASSVDETLSSVVDKASSAITGAIAAVTGSNPDVPTPNPSKPFRAPIKKSAALAASTTLLA